MTTSHKSGSTKASDPAHPDDHSGERPVLERGQAPGRSRRLVAPVDHPLGEGEEGGERGVLDLGEHESGQDRPARPGDRPGEDRDGPPEEERCPKKQSMLDVPGVGAGPARTAPERARPRKRSRTRSSDRGMRQGRSESAGRREPPGSFGAHGVRGAAGPTTSAPSGAGPERGGATSMKKHGHGRGQEELAARVSSGEHDAPRMIASPAMMHRGQASNRSGIRRASVLQPIRISRCRGKHRDDRAGRCSSRRAPPSADQRTGCLGVTAGRGTLAVGRTASP